MKTTKEHIEIYLLAATLLTTVVISALTLHQTTKNFEIERTSSFVARLNSKDMVDIRERVDRWLRSGESATALYQRSDLQNIPNGQSAEESKKQSEDAIETIANLRTLANFFQEFGTALQIDSVDEQYAYALAGGICIRYGDQLRPFIEASRVHNKRTQAYSEVSYLYSRMNEIDRKLGASVQLKGKL